MSLIMVYKHGMPLSAPMAMTLKEKRMVGSEKGGINGK